MIKDREDEVRKFTYKIFCKMCKKYVYGDLYALQPIIAEYEKGFQLHCPKCYLYKVVMSMNGVTDCVNNNYLSQEKAERLGLSKDKPEFYIYTDVRYEPHKPTSYELANQIVKDIIKDPKKLKAMQAQIKKEELEKIKNA